MSEPAEKLFGPRFDVRLDREDNELLERLVRKEKLSKAEIIRRAIRVYADAEGLNPLRSIAS